jgi:hypothetical protein
MNHLLLINGEGKKEKLRKIQGEKVSLNGRENEGKFISNDLGTFGVYSNSALPLAKTLP